MGRLAVAEVAVFKQTAVAAFHWMGHKVAVSDQS